MKMHTLGHDFVPDPIHAGGLRYHGMSPLISHLYETGEIEAVAKPQTECFAAGVLFARTEGIVPAPEPTHALAAAVEEALRCKETGEEKVILTALCGHGHLDLPAYDAYLSGEVVDHAWEDADTPGRRGRGAHPAAGACLTTQPFQCPTSGGGSPLGWPGDYGGSRRRRSRGARGRTRCGGGARAGARATGSGATAEQEAQAAVVRARETLATEETDVRKLESYSPTRIWAALRGSRDADLDREQAEKQAAEYAVARAEAWLRDANDEVERSEAELAALGDVAGRRERALAAKEEWLKSTGGEAGVGAGPTRGGARHDAAAAKEVAEARPPPRSRRAVWRRPGRSSAQRATGRRTTRSWAAACSAT